MLLGAYDLGVATPRALVHAGDKTSGDARSWYMISGDAKSWVVIVLHIFTVILHNCPMLEVKQMIRWRALDDGDDVIVKLSLDSRFKRR
ncbi:hypothetical protein Tco_1309434, partial [Tanacetum coccineum]